MRKLAFHQCFRIENLRIHEDAVPENTKKAMNFDLKV